MVSTIGLFSLISLVGKELAAQTGTGGTAKHIATSIHGYGDHPEWQAAASSEPLRATPVDKREARAVTEELLSSRHMPEESSVLGVS